MFIYMIFAEEIIEKGGKKYSSKPTTQKVSSTGGTGGGSSGGTGGSSGTSGGTGSSETPIKKKKKVENTKE